MFSIFELLDTFIESVTRSYGSEKGKTDSIEPTIYDIWALRIFLFFVILTILYWLMVWFFPPH